ncbi:hypothetical protein ACLKA7_011959 [Drosophila subpalustris]
MGRCARQLDVRPERQHTEQQKNRTTGQRDNRTTGQAEGCQGMLQSPDYARPLSRAHLSSPPGRLPYPLPPYQGSSVAGWLPLHLFVMHLCNLLWCGNGNGNDYIV